MIILKHFNYTGKLNIAYYSLNNTKRKSHINAKQKAIYYTNTIYYIALRLIQFFATSRRLVQ